MHLALALAVLLNVTTVTVTIKDAVNDFFRLYDCEYIGDRAGLMWWTDKVTHSTGAIEHGAEAWKIVLKIQDNRREFECDELYLRGV